EGPVLPISHGGTGSSTGSASNLIDLNATQLTSGTVPAARLSAANLNTAFGSAGINDSSLSANVALLGSSNTFTGATQTVAPAAGLATVAITAVAQRARLTLSRTTSSVQSWSLDTGVTTDLRFYDETGTTSRMTL